MRVWRLCPRRRSATAFDGEGARLVGGRWNPRGIPAVYTSATLSLAALELLVHASIETVPADLVALGAEVPDDLAVRQVTTAELPRSWRAYPAPVALQELGSAWLASGGTAVLEVPSVVVPQEHNYVLNPRHPDFTRIAVSPAEPFSFDPRLRRRRAGN